jgi:kynurenine 3-monooxygenase
MSSTKHIAITGAGLVGSLLAIYLRKRGYAVTVFERRGDLRKTDLYAGRSINLALSTRGIKALEEIGLAEEIKKAAIPMHGRMMHSLQGDLSFLPYGKQGQFINSISRSNMNTLLINEAEKLGAEFLFDYRCLQVDLDQTSLTLHNNISNTTATRQYDLIIGADGAFSAVRGAMQFTDRFDFSQDYIDHGYKELHIPAGAGNAFQLEKNALHIWPRESFMMIALPNPDGTFTCTLFFPFEGQPSFQTLRDDPAIRNFFMSNFPDAVKLMPGLLEDFHSNPTSSLVTMKCFPWVRNKTLLIGDAAHAIVPFYGQGMNAGFEDCRILNQLLAQHQDDWNIVLPEFQRLRKPDTDAIAQLALDNFIEMRDLVADADFLLRKKIEAKLHELYPDQWIPLYSMVTFNENIRYSDAYSTGRKQRKIMDEVMKKPGIGTTWPSLPFDQIVSQLHS